MDLLHLLVVTVVFLASASQVEAVCSISTGQTKIRQCETRYGFQLVRVLKIFGGLRTSEEVDAYCSHYNAIIACLDSVTSDCPSGESALDLAGYDKTSAAKAFQGYCKDKYTYVGGISCYDANDDGLTTCENTYGTALSNAGAAYGTTSDIDTFYKTLCPAQVRGIQCVLGALSTCSSTVREVIKNTGFAMLHGRCKNATYTSETSAYDSLVPTAEACSISKGQMTIAQCQADHQFDLNRVMKILGGLWTSVEVEAYCSNYKAVIACLDPVTSGCPSGESALDLTGYDKVSASKAFKGYCNDKSTYLSGVPCYNTNNVRLASCENAYFIALTAARIKFHTPTDGFYKQLCPAQVEGIKCILDALSTCTSAVQGVIKNTGYAMLHSRCKNAQYTTETSAYDTSGQQAFPLSMVLFPVTLMAIIIGG